MPFRIDNAGSSSFADPEQIEAMVPGLPKPTAGGSNKLSAGPQYVSVGPGGGAPQSSGEYMPGLDEAIRGFVDVPGGSK